MPGFRFGSPVTGFVEVAYEIRIPRGEDEIDPLFAIIGHRGDEEKGEGRERESEETKEGETKTRKDGQRKDKAWFRLNLDGGKSRCAPGWGELE